MLHNYHTHTARCNHAQGEDRQYVEEAIKAGMKTLGFSDHAPHVYPVPSNHQPHWCMRPSEMEGYVKSVRALQKEYANDIRILCGVELEYTPDFHAHETAFLKQFDLDYILLGQHFLGSILAPTYGAERGEAWYLNYYVSTLLSAIATGDFAYIAHPDIAGYEFDEEVMKREYRRLCEGAKRLGIPLEINLLGIRENRWYAKEPFFKIAAEVGNDVILGVDAHSPSALGTRSGESVARDLAAKTGVKLIDKLNF